MNFVSNLQVPGPYGLGIKLILNIFDCINYDNGVCRTVLATIVLLKSVMFGISAPDFRCQVSGVWCCILVSPAARATAFSLANCTTLQCRTKTFDAITWDGLYIRSNLSEFIPNMTEFFRNVT